MILKNYNLNNIAFLDYYQPYRHGTNASFNNFSVHILNLKKNIPSSFDYFLPKILPIINNVEFTICSVPSSDAGKINLNGISVLARKIAQKRDTIIDGSNCLLREITVPKAHMGGERNVSLHLSSIIAADKNLITNKYILLIDDVTTTGCSLNACKNILMKYASGVETLALGKTVE